MKDLREYLNEANLYGGDYYSTSTYRKLKGNNGNNKYNYQPKDKKELQSLLEQLIKERGNEGDFNDIDTSLITDMSWMFYDNKKFNGDISQWNTSEVTDMSWMFWYAKSFNQPIGNWDTSKVTDMSYMFENAKSFNQDISNWKVNKVKSVKSKIGIFKDCPIKEEYKPKFK